MTPRPMLLWALPFVLLQQAFAASSVQAPVTAGRGIPGPGCEDGLVYDDGSYETAYGWVPSAVWGEYVQTFQLEGPGPHVLQSVCICWTRTREDDSLDFDLEVYEDVDGVPAEEPLVVVSSSFVGVPLWTEGMFVDVPVGPASPALEPGTYHIGARWGPSVDGFFFICADQSNPDQAVPGFFRDDRSEEWDAVLETGDPIFAEHTAMLVRVRTRGIVPVPAIGTGGAGIIVVLIVMCAWWRLAIMARRG